MSRFMLIDTSIPDLRIIERKTIRDTRGFLCRLFCREELSPTGWTKPVVQINHTCTMMKGTIRGMHFQYPPHAEMKLVTCLKGSIWDVAVDIRQDSRTFLQWYGTELSADNCRALLIPEGFAHGFQALSDNVELLYCHSEVYDRDAESGINPLDPRLAIGWPLPVAELSEKDGRLPFIHDNYEGIRL